MEITRKNDELFFENRRLVTKNASGYMKINGIDTTTNSNPLIIEQMPNINGTTLEDKLGNILNDGRIVNIWYEVDTTSRTFGTSYADGRTWTNHTKTAGNKILLSFACIMRNSTSTTSWGGGYIQIDYSVDGGTAWTSLGDSGYDAVMLLSAAAIGSISGTFLVDIGAVTNATQIRIRFRHRAYSDTLLVNQDWAAEGAMFTNLTLQEIGV